MAYFSNSSEGKYYRERYCSKCINHRDKNDGRGIGCPIWDLHLLHNGEKQFKEILDFLIEREDCGNKECSMFLSKENEEKNDIFSHPKGWSIQ